MKRLSVMILALAVILTASTVFAASKSELKRMSVFLSNFTELGLYNFDIDTISMNELLNFGIWHNYINNHSLVKHVENHRYDSLISGKNVAASVKKYFDLPVRHQDVQAYDDIYEYKNGMYNFPAADGEIPTYADVQEVSRKGNVITMRGELYNAEEEDDIRGEFVAKAKPHKWNGKDTWAILSLKSTFYDR